MDHHMGLKIGRGVGMETRAVLKVVKEGLCQMIQAPAPVMVVVLVAAAAEVAMEGWADA